MRFFLGIVLAGALVCASYLGSAYIGLDALADAIRAGDAGEVIARTDAPRLRASLTGQIAEAVLEAEGRRRTLSPLERSVIGTVVTTVTDEIVTLMLQPDTLTMALRSGHFAPARGVALAAMPSVTELDLSRAGDVLRRVRLYRVNEFALRLTDDDDPERSAAIRMRFSMVGWKLSAVELPRRALREFAESLRRR